MSKTIILRVSAIVLAVVAVLTPLQPAQAACRSLSVYTDYFRDKPSIFIWNGAVRPEPSRTAILYYSETSNWLNVPSPSDDGVRTDAPQAENQNGWYIYFIASRWYLLHPGWNDDSRWRVSNCS